MWKSLIFLALAMFTVGCNIYLIAGLLPQIGQTIGQPVAVAGQGVSIFSLAYLCSAPVFSVVFANKPAKGIIQLALTLFIIGNLVTMFSENVALFLIGRSIAGVGAGIFTPLCIGIAMHLVDESAKGRVLSFVWGANSAGVVFGVPLGLYLASMYHWKFAIGLIVASSLVSLIGFSLQKADIKMPESPSIADRLRPLVDPKTLAVIGVSCFTAMASLGLFSYVTLLQSGSPHSLSLTLFCWGLGGFVGSSVIGFFIDKSRKPRLVMSAILLGLMLTILSIPFAKNIPFLGLVPFFLWGMFGWATATPQQKILFELHETQGTILAALNSSAFGLGSAIGTAIGGLIISSGFKEANLPFPAAALLLAVLIGQLVIMNNSELNNSKKVCST